MKLVFCMLSISAMTSLALSMITASRIFSKRSIRMASNSATVVLDKGKSRLFKDGNPIIYGGAINSIMGNTPKVGEDVLVQDHQGNAIGRGFFNPHSQYRVRMIVQQREKDLFSLPIEEIIKARIDNAVALRHQLGFPSDTNNVYRLVNGEGDRLGGLIIDVFDTVAVVQSSALWTEIQASAICTALRSALGNSISLLWRRAQSRLDQDGWKEASSDMNTVSAAPINVENKFTGSIIVLENGVKYEVSPDDGQKTGFYCDQRDARATVRGLSKGKDVLDTYCYSGGFSINAALGGAKSITSVDSSAAAVSALMTNMKLNQVPVGVEVVKADAIEYMQHLAKEGKKYDVVICDPPKLAPSRTSLPKAKNKYIRINTEAMRVLKSGGLLYTFSCSAAVTQTNALKDFVKEAAIIAGRDVTILSVTHAAKDHTVHSAYDEGSYLTGLLCCVR